ncbi:MAG: hypothetical protein ABFD10_11915 [Prolixibacteraceae bacterium]
MRRTKLSNIDKRVWLTAIAGILLVTCQPGAAKKQLPEVVATEKMQEIYDEVKTPFKYGLILVPDSNSHKFDCPTVFRHDNKWLMTYIVFDGKGYETCLAESDDLLNWERKGRLLSYSGSAEWDANQKAGYPALIDYRWEGGYAILRYDGNYWMSYLGGDTQGYEKGLLSAGIAFTKQDPGLVHEWQRLDKPVLSSAGPDARWYDNSVIYKSFIIEDHDRLTGHPFVMFYNARGDSLNPGRGAERISMAVSDDLLSWKRFGNQPVINHHKGISGDAVFQKICDVYVMFYFGAFWPGEKAKAFDTFACSYDLLNWTEWEGPHLIEPSEPYDGLFAHKPWVLKHDDIVYHFYNAVDTLGNRGIALATSKDLGKSPLKFNSVTESEVK